MPLNLNAQEYYTCAMCVISHCVHCSIFQPAKQRIIAYAWRSHVILTVKAELQ